MAGFKQNNIGALSLTEYKQALVDYACQINDVTPLETLRDLLFQKIATGLGKTMIQANPTGKTFQFQLTMTVEQQFSAVCAAIKTFNDEIGDSPVTFVDFSRAFGSIGGGNPLI